MFSSSANFFMSQTSSCPSTNNIFSVKNISFATISKSCGFCRLPTTPEVIEYVLGSEFN
jgi:hypothetical protein